MNHITFSPFAAATTAAELTTIAIERKAAAADKLKRLEFLAARLAGGDSSEVVFLPFGVDISKVPDYTGWSLLEAIDDQMFRAAHLIMSNKDRALPRLRAVRSALEPIRDTARHRICNFLWAELLRRCGKGRSAEDSFRTCQLGPIGDMQIARIRIESGDAQAKKLLHSVRDRLDGSEYGSILIPVCCWLLAQTSPEQRFDLLREGYQRSKSASTLPTAEHLALYCEYARELRKREKLDEAHRVMDGAAELCRRNRYLDGTCVQSVRAALYLAQADTPGEEDERYRDYVAEAIKLADLAHGNRRLEDASTLNRQTLNYIALAYITHGEAIGKKEFHRTLSRFNLATDFAEAGGDRELFQRAQKLLRKMLEPETSLLVLTMEELAADFNKEVVPLVREKLIAYLLVIDRRAEHLHDLTHISKSIIQHTIRTLDRKARSEDMSDHVQAWRAVFPDGFRVQRQKKNSGC